MRHTLLAAMLLATTDVFGQIRLMSENKDAALRESLPWVDDDDIQKILDDPDTVLYTDTEIRPAYQEFNVTHGGVRDPAYNHAGGSFSANIERAKGHGYGGNGNVEFPWRAPAGTEPCTNVTTFRFFRLPSRRGGGHWPVVYWTDLPAYRDQLGVAPCYHWMFPTGTVFGEVLTMRHPQTRENYTFELRVRTREAAEWAVDVFRPYPAAANLASQIAKLRPDWREDRELRRFVAALGDDSPDKRGRLRNRHPKKVVFDESAGIDELDPIDTSLVNELLTSVQFRSALGTEWKRDCHAPTTKAAWHIVPTNYRAGFVPVDRESCIRCHDSCGKHTSVFEDRDWYGNVRGSDGIFTWHLFDSRCVSGFPQNGGYLPPMIRRDFVQHGIIERFDRQTHRPPRYNLIRRLRYEVHDSNNRTRLR